ncbi:MAG: histidine kinase [Cohnella sp.]|nr:histidine kinase [Cohnella sp.]
MKLKSKIILFTTVWLVFLLIVVDMAVYLSFLHTATRNEVQTLQRNTNDLVEKYGVSAFVAGKPLTVPDQELPDNTVIRVLTPDSRLIRQITNASPFPLPGAFFTLKEDWNLAHLDGDRILTIHFPLKQGQTVIGALEVSENLESLESNIRLLITILVSTAVGAIILCVLGGSFLFRTVIRPVTRMIRTMESIENSLSLRKIPVSDQERDELSTMTHTFNRMVDRLEESIDKQRRFVSDASHELGTTVTIIEGYANMLRRWGMQEPEALRESVESIHDEAKRMRAMTDQLMSLTASDKGEDLSPIVFDLVSGCRNAMRLATKLDQREMTISANPETIPIYADPAKITQLMLILLDNALKYSEDRIQVNVASSSGSAIIKVRDYGIGIPNDRMERIFDRFYRVDEARARETGGTGLGLAIAQSIAQEHGGSVRAESEWGVGTTMVVRLPLSQNVED